MGDQATAPMELGTRFRTVQSQVATIPFDSGNTRSVELPRSFLYKMIGARLRGSVTAVAGASGVAADQQTALIKRLDIVADGRKILYSASGPAAYRLSNLFQGKAGEVLTAAGGAGAIQPFAGGFYVHHEAARMRTPVMSYFDPRPYEKVEARVQWGTIADFFTTPSTATVNAVTALDLQPVQSMEGAPQIGFNRLTMFDEFTFAGGAVSNFAINVPRAGLLAGILLRTTTTGPVYTDAFFQSATLGSEGTMGTITLKSDNNFLHLDNLNATTLQSRNLLDYALDASTFGGRVTGNYYIDLSEDGLATSLLNTFDLNVLQLVISNQGAAAPVTTLQCTYIFYEPLTAA
jgi:hypothetical protein